MATLLTNEEIIAAVGIPKEVVTGLTSTESSTYEAASNAFLSAIVNKICYQKVDSMEFTNPFKKYDSYPIEYGDSLENVYIDIKPGAKFDRNATDPFAKSAPAVKAAYAHINYEMQYAITIERDFVRRAVLNKYGFQSIVDRILASLVTKRDIDEYSATIISLNNVDNFANGFEDVDVSSAATEADKMDIIVHNIVSVYKDFALPSPDNNKFKVETVTPLSHCLLIIKQDILNKINLDYLKGVFNLDKVDLINNIIPIRSFKTVVNTTSGGDITPGENGTDIDYVILDDRGFDNHLALQDGGSIYNPKGRYTNYFVDYWKVFGFKPYCQARAFKLKTE